MEQEVAVEYLKWLSNVAKKQNQYLIWDVYLSHISEEVKATEVKMQLSFLPGGQTGTWQPLDYRVFGCLKARARARSNAAVLASRLRGGAWGDQLNNQKVAFSRVFT